MERQVHVKAEAEWQHALDLEKKLKASSRWGIMTMHHLCCPPAVWCCLWSAVRLAALYSLTAPFM
jgi:hypothetical protein